MSIPLAETSGWTVLLLVLLIIICFLLILVVLLQKGRGGGIGAAFGGMGNAAFGTRTGDVFTWITIVLTGLFLLLAIGSVVAVRPKPSPVAKPVISITPDASGEATLTIRSDTNGSTVYYTLDGSEPTKNSKQFRGPVKVDPDVVIRAIGVKDGYYNSVEAKYPEETHPASYPSELEPLTRPASGPASAPAKTPATKSANK